MNAMRIGEKIKQRRIERKMSATQLGRLVGRSPTTIIEIEEGGTKDPKVSIIRAIADELQVSVDWLTDDKQGGSPPATTLEGKIVEAVHDALTPFQSFSDLTQDEALIIAALRERGIRQRSDDLGAPMFDAIESLMGLWDAAHDVGIVDADEDNEAEMLGPESGATEQPSEDPGVRAAKEIDAGTGSDESRRRSGRRRKRA